MLSSRRDPKLVFVPRPAPLSSCLVVLAGVGLGIPIAYGHGVDRDAHSVRSVFFVAKSENSNQVHYGIRLDETCAPSGDAPVFAYWRMLERGPLATEPLLARETPAYGFAAQHAAPRDGPGGHVVVTLNALPKRPIAIDSTASGAMCTAKARAMIAGVPASLTSVFVQLRWPFGVDYIVLFGRADGLVVHERVAN
jgi:hypothetical protein